MPESRNRVRTPSPRQIEALEAVASGCFYPSLRREDDGWHARWISPKADSYWVDMFVRGFTLTPLSADAETQRHFTLHDAWLLALRSRTGLVVWDDAECEAFAGELAEWSAGAAQDMRGGGSVSFLFEPAGGGSFMVSCATPKGRAALRSLGRSAGIAGELKRLSSRTGGPGRLAAILDRDEAQRFIASGAPALEAAGYRVDGCDLKVQVALDAEAERGGGCGSGALKQESYKASLTVRVDGEKIGAAEIRFLLEQKSTLVFFRNRWIEVDRNILKAALRALEKTEGKPLALNEAIALESGTLFDIPSSGAAHGGAGAIRSLVASLRRSGETLLAGACEPSGFAGRLMEYQKRGVQWMSFLSNHGFGALLADEMGLGKTVQTIAWMLAAKTGRTLVVVPLTLVSNWKRELEKFAPGLSVYIHHGRDRQLESGFFKYASASDVTVTSHAVFVRDYAAIRRVEWGAAVLDEAQIMKNPGTRIARCLCRLPAPRRLALTGTPVENSPMDVWSIEKFLNPGLLGEMKVFKKKFCAVAGTGGGSPAARLRRILDPFVLRRLKSEGEVAGELGPRREIKEYCPLSPRQRCVYESALEEYRSGERRRGDMFSLISKLKHACDGDGKFERLDALLDSVFAAGESVLVFTQFVKVAEAIRRRIENVQGWRAWLLDGSMDAKGREKAISEFSSFQGPAAFVLSLRAGGYGLNLVKASRVIHFDRWWNPAVESQATARAHRLGQEKTVFVHAFITEGTLEERIDALLERKSRIAEEVVSGGESFLKSLTGEEFEELVKLDG